MPSTIGLLLGTTGIRFTITNLPLDTAIKPDLSVQIQLKELSVAIGTIKLMLKYTGRITNQMELL